jgi:uncharacterized membrane protein YcaP (DUF421 family)
MTGMFVEDPHLDSALRGLILTLFALLWVLVLARVVGLRSFSKMTAFDFVATFATGSLLANAATRSSWSDFIQPVVALSVLFGVQVLLAWLRHRSTTFQRLIDNRPAVLMRRGDFDEAALRRNRIARADVLAKLREANATQLGEACYVVLEATGDMSVIRGDDVEVDDALMDDVDTR